MTKQSILTLLFVCSTCLAFAQQQESTSTIRKQAIKAFKNRDYKKAQQFSIKMLKLSQEQKTWDTGNAIFHGNMILGRIAIAKNDVKLAKKYLLLAGKTMGSPQLNSFGPNMLLAEELLQKKEYQVVIQFFQLCRKFWKSKKAERRLKEWEEDIQNKKIPNFRANLRFGGWS